MASHYSNAPRYVEDYDDGGRHNLGCSILIVFFCLLVALAGIGGFFGYKLYNSAKSVQEDARVAMSAVDTLKDTVMSGNAEALNQTVSNITVSAHNIHDEVNTKLWEYATYIPVYGEDIKSVRTLADVLVDLSDNALAPIASNSSVLSLSSLLADGSVNVGLLQSLSGTLNEAIPVITRSADTVNALPEAHIDKVNDILAKVKDKLGTGAEALDKVQQILPYLPAMLGADGQTRNYLIMAQNNAEARSLGGLPGSWGIVSITDGQITLGDFQSILHEDGLQVDAWDDEKQFFDVSFDTDPAQINVLPDFMRVGQLSQQYWWQSQGQWVNGVIAIDPVFLQHMLALTGGIEVADGTYIDGSNAAQELMSGVYWRYGSDNDAHDVFFSNVAETAAKSFFANIGNASFTDLFKTVLQMADEHRIYIWMENEAEEELMSSYGFSGRVAQDINKPELGIFINDVTWSKISWYLNVDVSVGDGVKQEDGTTAYDVTVALNNIMTPEESWASPYYVCGYNPDKESDGDMITLTYFLAPYGGSIQDISSETASWISSGWVYGTEGKTGFAHTDCLESTVYTMRVVVPAEVTEPLAVRVTPLAREDALNITYAWAQ